MVKVTAPGSNRIDTQDQNDQDRGSIETNDKSDNLQQQPLLVYWSRWWSIFIVLIAGGLAVICTNMVIHAWPDRPILLALTGTGTIVSVYACMRVIRNTFHPVLMFMADQNGITTYYNDKKYSSEGYCVPWHDITGLSLAQQEVAGDPKLKMHCIAVQLAENAEVPETLSVGGSPGADVFYLDASTGALKGQKLLNALNQIRPD